MTETAAETTAEPKPVPGVPVRLGQADGQPMPTGTWAATVIDRTKEITAGMDRALTVGTLVTVEAPTTGSVPIKVQLDYSSFENLYGADWSSRLRLVQFPECYLTTPLEEACQAYTELESVNDAGADSITATVDTAADGTTAPASFTGGTSSSGPAMMQASYTTATPTATGGDKAVVGAVDSGAGNGGSFKATPLASSGKWSAGGSSGAFTWSYPLVIPPTPAGPAPNVSFNYSSQTVDGKTSVSSPQASWIGEGWDYDPGHIERRYRACKDDTKTLKAGVPNNTAKADKTSDLCWVSYNAVMSLGGKTTELVRDDAATTNAETGTETYRSQNDDGTRIQRHTGGTNGDNNGEYWVVTTTDGTKYYFGQNKVDGGHANTNSVSTVPVFGNHPTEPCYQETFANSRCGTSKQAWRWGLDKVVDVHGNVMVINWTQEKNHYAVREKRKTPEQYDRFAYPTSIEYGMRAGTLTNPAAKVEFGVQQRCLKSDTVCAPANFDKTGDAGAYRAWWDTPGALNCKSTSTLCPAFPSFWTQMRLGAVTTWAARAGQTSLGKVDTWNLYQSFPEDWYDSSPGLWLNSITRTGFGPGDTTGTKQSKDGVSFAKYTVGTTSPLRGRLKDQQLRNLVPTGEADKRPPFTRPRIGTVATETGGSIEVEYAGGCATEPAEDKGQANTYCYPVRWSPDGEEKTPAKAWFNKYVVDSITETDKVTSPFSKPIYTKYRYYGPAWAKSNDEFTRPALRTYSDWRGYGRVTVTKGSSVGDGTWYTPQSQSFSEARYFQGIGGEIKDSTGKALPVANEPQYAGMTSETISYLNSDRPAGGMPKVVSRTLSVPESTPTASRSREAEDGSDPGPLVAHRISVKQSDAIQTIGTSWQAVRTATLARDEHGLPTKVETAVVKPNGTGGENLSEQTCTKTVYIDSTSDWLIGLPQSKRTTATSCANVDTAIPATELKGSVEITYDGGAALTRGLPTKVSEIDGTGTSHSVTTTTTYDPLGRIRTTIAPGSGTTETEYTPGDEGGPVTAVKTSKTVNGKVHETTTTFDPGRALPLTVTDPNGRVTRTQYDALGRLVKGWSASRSSGSQSPNVEIDYQPAIATATETSPAAVTVKSLKDDGTYATQITVYDGLMRQVQTQSEAVGPGRIISDTKYNDQGLPAEQTSGYLAKGNPETKAFEVKSASLIPSRVKTVYDGLARATRQTTFHGATAKYSSYTGYVDNSVTVDPPGSTVPKTTTTSDALGRVTDIRHYTTLASSGPYRTTTYGYDRRGNRTSVTDPAGNAWTYIYDARGRVTSSTDPDTGTTETHYDEADRPVEVKDQLQQVTKTTYDTLGRITEVNGGPTTAPQIKRFTYDMTGALGLPWESKRVTSAGEYIDRVTGYDTEYRPTGRETVIPQNTMTTGLSGTYSYAYTYTPTGKPLSVTLPAKGGLNSEKVITRYTEDGLPESTSGHSWYTTDITYSPYGEVLRTVSGAQPYRVWTTNFVDEHTGRLQRTVSDREATNYHRIADARYAYDTSGMITASARELADGAVRTWDNQCFTYDAMGQLVNAWTSSITPPPVTQGAVGGTGCKSASGATWGHRFDGASSSGPVADAAHQAGASAPASLAGTAPFAGTIATDTTAYRQSFTYDWLGNRATHTDHDPAGNTANNTSYTYNYLATQPHTLASVASADTAKSSTYTYNPTGTTRTRGFPGDALDQNLMWTSEQKLESNTVGTGTTATKTTYVYDAAGNRLLENSPTGSTLYLGETELTTDKVGLITRASRSYGQAGAPTVVRTTNGTTTGHTLSALITDHLGTANTTVELSTGQPVTRRSFKPYGELRGPKPTTWPNKRSYLGVGIDDTTTGLTHIGAREYDQKTGRFLSADPIIDFTSPLQMNGYTYANNNPTTLSDPTGLMPACGVNGRCESGSGFPETEVNRPDPSSGESGNGGATNQGVVSETSVNETTYLEYGPGSNPLPVPEIGQEQYLEAYHRNLEKWGYKPGTWMEAEFFKLRAHYFACLTDGVECTDNLKWKSLLSFAEAAGFDGNGRPLKGHAGKGTGKGKGDCTRCFLAGTDVLMSDRSTKNIEDIEPGDEILAADPLTGESGPRTVTRLIVTEDDKHFNELTIGTEVGLEKLTATHEHPFWSPSESNWIEAGRLTSGMTLLTDDNDTVTVLANRAYTQHARTYNLTVDDLHTYYVLAGETPVLVHNSNCGPAEYYRGAKGGGPSFVPRPNDYKVDPATGFVKETHGVSLFDNPGSITSRGFESHGIDPASMPSTLRVIQRGKDLRHYEIVPSPGANLTPARYTEELSKIRCMCGGGG
ncbi:polymorphic toxin-type HINT domain-containing protein [Streptomyces exfoliatus]|uniref:polymorphic toxin-type HINT domain-containing protein n=1 Tax=Streptomyces exfoliatus TaxID=1905 RepID=UPI001FE04851|nr:polymorphic toxin-type HINT domain-containing protein [Streptomyces exfoliatus]